MLKTADSQDIIYTSMTDDINVTINILYLFILNRTPSVEIQLMFNEATQKNLKKTYDEDFTEVRVISNFLVQHDIGSAQQVNNPKCSISAHQKKDRTITPDKNNNIAIFDNPDLRKYYAEIDGQRYTRDVISINYTENDFIDQYRDLKFIF